MMQTTLSICSRRQGGTWALVLAGLLLACPALAQVSGTTCSGSPSANPDTGGRGLKCTGSVWTAVPVTGTGTVGLTAYNSATRVTGSTYQNNTGKMLFVYLSDGGGAGFPLTCLTDSAASPTTVIVGSTTSVGTFARNASFPVLKGNYYACNYHAANLVYWNEMVLPY